MEDRNYFDFNRNWIDDIEVGFGKNAWYVQKPLSECRNLFYNIKSDFVVHFFGCDCGKNHIYINKSENDIKHICEKCGRENFTFLKYADRKTAYVNLENIYSFKKTSEYYMATCYLRYPKHIDINSNSLIYENKIAYEIRMDMDCAYSSRISYRISDEVKNRARAELLDFIGQDLHRKINNFKTLEFKKNIYEAKERIVNFFIKNPTLIDAEFFFVDKQYIEIMPKKKNYTIKKMLDDLLPKNATKALKKTFYKNYQCSMKNKYFHVSSKIVSFYIFKDQNFSRTFLENNVSLHCSLGQSIEDEIALLKMLLLFLKKFYTEKELLTICLQIKDSRQYWEDIIMIYENSSEHIHDVFRRVNANIIHIHNAFMSSVLYNYETVIFKYTKKERLRMGVHGGLKYVLPKSSKVLFDWGIQLKNCLVAYVEKVALQHSIIVGVFEDKKLRYALEINLENNQIVQMSAFANKEIPQLQADSIKKWHNDFWLID